ncbi:MAG: hypothetical protein AUH41_13845 [Gemmatimonadetes bacterium 13_1_40CM_66_11]|nr:MAG: hypothetical protein AUH41_13845 [Gemmatimonadetes bacterium 13_1_40CM_66_11]
MTDEQKEAIERLERRVATLENMVRRLTFAAPGVPAVRTVTPPPPAPPVPTTPPPEKTDLEQWFGQRGLLAIGVAALLIAAALFLKYAFDRGWIPPIARSVGAIVAGIGIAAWGHERIGRGMRRYGAAMIGAGGGLTYLGLWAAAGPYVLMDRRLGILLLAATTVAVTMLALHHEIEGLAIWALSGAYLAPLILQTAPNPQGFLGYLEVIGLGTGILAYGMSWRATFDLALFGYLILAAAGAAPAIAAPLGAWLVAAGALLTLHVTIRRSWPEARLGVLIVAWPILGTGLAGVVGSEATRWLTLSAAAAVTGVLWWQHFQRDPFRVETAQSVAPTDVAVDRLLFSVNPMAFMILAAAAQAHLLTDSFQIVPAALSAAYLPAGWIRRSASHLIAGFLLLAFALPFPWSATSVAVGWTVLAFLALAAEREGARPGGRHAAVALASAAWVWLFSVALFTRGLKPPIFTDGWALALYVLVSGTALTAWWWGTEGKPLLWMWILCGSAVFLGGSIEFQQYFARMTALAGDLALSVWWLVFAGALVFLGFRLNHKMVRSTGLGVAAFAGLKIVLVDLSNLEALYRVGSFFALALIALAVAYAYNQRAHKQTV